MNLKILYNFNSLNIKLKFSLNFLNKIRINRILKTELIIQKINNWKILIMITIMIHNTLMNPTLMSMAKKSIVKKGRKINKILLILKELIKKVFKFMNSRKTIIKIKIQISFHSNINNIIHNSSKRNYSQICLHMTGMKLVLILRIRVFNKLLSNSIILKIMK